MVAKKETVAKKKTIGKEKPKKENQKSKKISLDHDFSFNLLTEPWLPVVTMKAEKKLLSLNEFLKSAHELERFDFPLPGLETAVIRFLVAIVYIVGAPKDKEDWEAWYNAGKFYDSFIKELQSYKDKLDLFSKTEPFMQEVNITEDKVKSRTKFKIIDFIPSGNNSIHFGNIDLKKKEEIYISPQAAILLLLFHQMIPRSLAAGSNERYINGIIGQSIPYFCYLKSSNLFESILANVLDEKYIKDNLEGKVLTELNGWNQLKVNKDLKAKEISLPLGFLWKSRSILFLPEQGIEKVCSILGIKSNISISKFCYAPQKHILLNKDESPWEDPFNAIKIVTETNKKGNKKSVIKKLKPSGKMLPAWKDYPVLIMFDNNQTANGTKERKISPPLILQRILKYKNKPLIFSVLTITTKDGQDKIFQIEESSFPFNPRFVLDEQVATKIKTIVKFTKKFENHLTKSLFKAMDYDEKIKKLPENKKKKKELELQKVISSLFQSSYWYELGSAFEESLFKLSGDEDSNQVLQNWKKMLASHVRDTFKRHTRKLISNPKNLKAYENGRRYLESMINKELLPKEKK